MKRLVKGFVGVGAALALILAGTNSVEAADLTEAPIQAVQGPSSRLASGETWIANTSILIFNQNGANIGQINVGARVVVQGHEVNGRFPVTVQSGTGNNGWAGSRVWLNRNAFQHMRPNWAG
ncbi:MAG: hypothetical protein FWF59_10060 [Turicibacter sp.]|nr:hypothetical protein [Turicibacter sp.]